MPEAVKPSGASIRVYMQTAPINAWTELLKNHDKAIAVGTPLCNSAATWAGNAARRTIHHKRGGMSSNATSRIELGIQRVETEPGWSVKANPILAVK